MALSTDHPDRWRVLRGLEQRWEDDPFFRNMRNAASFHLDADVVEAGLLELERQGTVIFVECNGERQDHSSLRLGIESLLKGSGMNLQDYDRLTKATAKDYGAAVKAIQLASTPAITRSAREETSDHNARAR